ncbi:MAG TPA: DNA sulfur modification protein DndB [Solirubrobacterales bacterium]|jgi:hypothetical protein|nr:DNA sulfur modification protein DndB [Solirubrobacterales bacterium]
MNSSATVIEEIDLEMDLLEPSGYATHDEYFAMCFQQGGRTVYSVDLSVPQLAATLPEPDPDHPQEGNRRINPSHARAFAEYVQERSNWVCPSLLLRAPEGEFEFHPRKEIGGTQLGVLSIPRLARNSLQILDGQHRILGFHLAWRAISENIQHQREALAIARRDGSDRKIQKAERALRGTLELRDRLEKERVSIDIVIVDDPGAYKQVFVDIADNAKGVTRTLSARFDRRKVVNRALPLVAEHPLVKGRIEEESDRLSSSNRSLLTAKHLADLIRTVQVGVARRISKKLEAELDERVVSDDAQRFLDVIETAFPQLQAIRKGEKSPSELRAESLLGSATILRVLAGVYHDLTAAGPNRMTEGEVADFFASLVSHMDAPIAEDGAWKATGVFVDSGMAPQASQGSLRKLTGEIVAWARNPPGWIA